MKVAELLTSPPPPPLPLARAAGAGTGADSPSNNAHENNDVVKAVTKIVRRATAAFTTVPGGSINVTSQAVDDVVTFRPLSSIGRNWLAAHPTLEYGIYCICIILFVTLISLREEDITRIAIKYYGQMILYIVGFLLLAPYYDWNISKKIMQQGAAFWMAFLLLLVSNVLNIYCFTRAHRIVGDISIPLLLLCRVPASICGLGVNFFALGFDAGVYMSSTSKRVVLVGFISMWCFLSFYIHQLQVHPELYFLKEGFIRINGDENERICFLIIYGCISPYAMLESLYRGQVIVYLRMLVAHIMYPDSFFFLSTKLYFKVRDGHGGKGGTVATT